MKKGLLTELALAMLFSLSAVAATNPSTFLKWGFQHVSSVSGANSEDWLYSVIQASDGYFVGGGYTEDTDYYGAVVKFDPISRKIVWEKRFGTGAIIYDVIETSAAYVAVGSTQPAGQKGSLMVVSIDKANPASAATFLFPAPTRFAAEDTQGFAIRNIVSASGANDGYAIVGTEFANIGYEVPTTAFILRLDANFKAMIFGGQSDGFALLGGDGPGGAAYLPESLCKKLSLTHTAAGDVSGFIAVGAIPRTSQTENYDLFVERLDLQGNVLAMKTITATDLEAVGPYKNHVTFSPVCILSAPSLQTSRTEGFDVVEIVNGGDFMVMVQANVTKISQTGNDCTNYLLDGKSYIDLTPVLVRITPGLQVLSAKPLGRFSGLDFQTPLVMMKDGFAVAGNDATGNATTINTRVIKTNFSGDVIWTGDYLIPGDSTDCAFAAAKTSDDGIVVAGNNDLNGDDYFALKIKPDCVVVPKGLVAKYSFNDSANTAADSSSYKNTGSWINGPAPTDAVVSSGLTFDGVNDYVEAPGKSQIVIGTGDLTIEGWIRVDPADAGGIRSIIDKRALSSGALYRGYHLALIDGVLWLQLADGGAKGGYSNFESAINVADGQWHFFAVSVQRTSKTGIRWYHNGVTAFVRDPTTRKGSLTNSSPLRFGRRTVDQPGWFKGTLDEIEIYNRVLTPAEITDIFVAGSAGRC
jgi:hypothetical protein